MKICSLKERKQSQVHYLDGNTVLSFLFLFSLHLRLSSSRVHHWFDVFGVGLWMHSTRINEKIFHSFMNHKFDTQYFPLSMMKELNGKEKIRRKKREERNESISYRLQMIFGVGNPSARQVILIFWFSRTATDDGVLSMSRIFGGTDSMESTQRKEMAKHQIKGELMRTLSICQYPGCLLCVCPTIFANKLIDWICMRALSRCRDGWWRGTHTQTFKRTSHILTKENLWSNWHSHG